MVRVIVLERRSTECDLVSRMPPISITPAPIQLSNTTGHHLKVLPPGLVLAISLKQKLDRVGFGDYTTISYPSQKERPPKPSCSRLVPDPERLQKVPEEQNPCLGLDSAFVL